MPDEMGAFLATIRCCSCEASLKHAKGLNMVQIDRLSRWPEPGWYVTMNGKKIEKAGKRALAVLCDTCAKAEKETRESSSSTIVEKPKIKYAIEWDAGTGANPKYHRIEALAIAPQPEPDMVGSGKDEQVA